jgi:hypothetical protein
MFRTLIETLSFPPVSKKLIGSYNHVLSFRPTVEVPFVTV